MADDSEFEFPPDQVGGEVALPPEPALGQIPFVILTQTPTDKLPPTHVPGAERRSIRQMLKGALHGYHRKPPFSALADLNLPHLRLSTSMDSNDSNKSSDTLAEAQHNEHVHYNKSNNNNKETVLTRNASNNANNINIESNTNSTAGDGSNGADETDFEHNSSQFNDPHVLHRGVEFDIAQSEHWGPKRAIRSEWSEKQVREFYTALSQYGTDFTAIAVLFKNRTRVDIKRLYNRELRRHPNEVRVALENRTPIDLGLFNKLLKTKRREEAPKHKVLAAEEEQMLKQIASSTHNPPSSSEMSSNTNTNKNANTNTKHSSNDGEDGNRNNKHNSNNNVVDEFVSEDEVPSANVEQVRRQVVKPHRLNTNTLEENININNKLHKPQTRKRERNETNRPKAKRNTTSGASVHANEENDSDSDHRYQHTELNTSSNVSTVAHRTQHLSLSSRASSVNRTPQRQTYTPQKHQINKKREELHNRYRSVSSMSASASSLSPSPRRTDNYSRSIDNNNDEKDDDETILEMELRRQEHQESELDDQITLAEAAWSGEFGELNEDVDGYGNQVDDEFHFDDSNDYTH